MQHLNNIMTSAPPTPSLEFTRGFKAALAQIHQLGNTEEAAVTTSATHSGESDHHLGWQRACLLFLDHCTETPSL